MTECRSTATLTNVTPVRIRDGIGRAPANATPLDDHVAQCAPLATTQLAAVSGLDVMS